MDYLNQRKFTTERVCATMGVPKIILNYTDNVNYSNAETQYKKFIENTIRPMEQFLTDVFTQLIAPVNTRVQFYIIDDHIDDKAEKGKIAIDNVTAGIWNRNEARAYIGNDPIDDPNMDEYTVLNSVTPLELMMSAPTEPVAPSENITPIKALKSSLSI